MQTLQNFVNGQFIEAKSSKFVEVTTPHTNEVIALVPLSQGQQVDNCMQQAQNAYIKWSALTIKARSSFLQRYLRLVEDKYMQQLADLIVKEHGKTTAEALAEISKGNETLKYASALSNFGAGNWMEVSRGVSCRDERVPLGVVASIVPFNFPYMVPFWTIGHALVSGNVVIVKPSEKVPLTLNLVASIWKEAGLPDGVFNLLHGVRETVEAIVDHPLVQAVTFVGTSNVAESLHQRCSRLNKRVLALGGAKNHLVAAKDCDLDLTAQDVLNSFAGCSGQRCMAASVLLTVGDRKDLLDKIVEKARLIKPGSSGSGHIGPVIDKASLEKITRYISEAESRDGALILIDGRQWTAQHSSGNWIGPTVLLHRSKIDAAMKEEIFGPVLSVYPCQTPQEAIDIQNSSQYGNAASIFTQDPRVADWFLSKFEAGMLGCNVGVPVPFEPFSFGGIKRSRFGYSGDITGDGAFEFFTQRRKVTTKWGKPAEQTWMS